MSLVKIKDTTFVRDTETNAILNTNRAELLEFNTKRKQILMEREDKEQTKKRLCKLEEDINDIKNLLRELTQLRSTNGN